MSAHALAALALGAVFIAGSVLLLTLVERADRKRAAERERARLEDAETAADEMRLAA